MSETPIEEAELDETESDEHYSCPYSEEELQYWDSVTNPMGDDCYNCLDFDCDHNSNSNNPNIFPYSDEDFKSGG